jgi:hypothetical protein
MERVQEAVPIIRKAALITLIGFLVIMLAGPVLSLLGVLLPFALVGLLVWIPFRLFVIGRQGGWTAVRQTTGRVLRTALAVPGRIVARVLRAAGWVLGLVFGLIGFVLRLALPTVAGVILGGALGVIGGIEHNDVVFRAPAGALIGGGIGLLAGALRGRRPRPVIIRVAPGELHRA